jgi:DNA primase
MALFPQSFIEDVRAAADIVAVVQESVALRRVGNSYKGLCPFHNEKSPSFNVNRDRGFFHCFGCGVGGDAIKFVELRDKIPFVEAVRILAVKFGIPIPEAREREGQEGEREAILNMHEIAAAYFRVQLASRDGSAARLYLDERGITAETIEALGYGLAPGYREGLKSRLLKQGFAQWCSRAACGRAAMTTAGGRSLPESAHDSDLPGRQGRSSRSADGR